MSSSERVQFYRPSATSAARSTNEGWLGSVEPEAQLVPYAASRVYKVSNWDSKNEKICLSCSWMTCKLLWVYLETYMYESNAEHMNVLFNAGHWSIKCNWKCCSSSSSGSICDIVNDVCARMNVEVVMDHDIMTHTKENYGDVKSTIHAGVFVLK